MKERFIAVLIIARVFIALKNHYPTIASNFYFYALSVYGKKNFDHNHVKLSALTSCVRGCNIDSLNRMFVQEEILFLFRLCHLFNPVTFITFRTNLRENISIFYTHKVKPQLCGILGAGKSTN